MLKALHSIDITIDAFMATVESIALSVVSRIATWSAPIPSAVAVTRSVMHTLELPLEVGVFVAITLEVFGIAAAHQWLEAKEWNATKKSREANADERIGKWATISYVIIAEVMIFTMELRTILETGQPWGLGAMVFPPMTLIIVLVANERMMQHQRKMDRMEAPKQERRASTMPKSAMALSAQRGTYQQFAEMQAGRNGVGAMSATEIQETFNVPRRTAYNWLEKAKGRTSQ